VGNIVYEDDNTAIEDSHDYYYEDNSNRRDGSGYGSDSGGGVGGFETGLPIDFIAPLILLAPLAGLAVLYAAAFISGNSTLITIAVLSGRKRRRRRRRRRRRSAKGKKMQKDILKYASLLSRYSRDKQDAITKAFLDRSGLWTSGCLHRLACDARLAADEGGGGISIDGLVEMSGGALVDFVLNNPFVEDKRKYELRVAKKFGKKGGLCKTYGSCSKNSGNSVW
jgi:hypothetical protein